MEFFLSLPAKAFLTFKFILFSTYQSNEYVSFAILWGFQVFQYSFVIIKSFFQIHENKLSIRSIVKGFIYKGKIQLNRDKNLRNTPDNWDIYYIKPLNLLNYYHRHILNTHHLNSKIRKCPSHEFNTELQICDGMMTTSLNNTLHRLEKSYPGTHCTLFRVRNMGKPYLYRVSFYKTKYVATEGDQDMPPQNMLLWHRDI